MARSPRKLNSAQYDENCQNLPKLTSSALLRQVFFPNFHKPTRFRNQYLKLHQKKCEEKNLRQNLKKPHWYISRYVSVSRNT